MSLQTLNYSSDKELINELLNGEITVYEDIQGTKIFINWDGDHFSFKQSNINNEPINLIDVALQKFYNPVIDYLSNLDLRVKSLLNKKWWFGFEYFPDEQPANIKYSKVPKNNLILTSIWKGKFEYSEQELIEYSNLMNVNSLPILFKGKLSQPQIEAITYFLNTSKNDLEYVFDETNFAFFFYRLLDPLSSNSFLMDDSFNENLEKIIIKSDKFKTPFQILNPLYKRVSETNSTEFVEIYSLVLINFLDFCQIIDLEKINLKSKKRDEMYIELICRLYNTYISDVKEDIKNFNFTIPKFFNKEKFRINVEIIPNKLTKEYIEEDKKLEYIFKVILGSFSKKRKKPIGIFTENTVKLFNNMVDQIQNHMDKKLNYFNQIELTKSGLLDFSTFFDINYDVDSEEEVYPTISEEDFDEPNIKDKKSKKETASDIEEIPSKEKEQGGESYNNM